MSSPIRPRSIFALLGIVLFSLAAWVFWYIAIYGFDIAQAACTGDIAEVKRLLDRNPDLISSRADGWTPLNWAARNGRVEVVGLLLDRGADINAKNEDGKTSIEIAGENGHEAVVKILKECGAAITNPTGD